MDTVLIVIVGVIGLAILGVGGYYLLRFMKGSIKIVMEKDSFSLGEKIQGSLDLKAKKQIESNRLFVSLVGEEKITEGYGKDRRTRNVEIYRFNVDVEGKKTYTSGFNNTYSFEIPLPANPVNAAKPDGTVGAIVSTLSMLSGTSRQVFWKVEARVDAQGVDLYNSKKVYLNLNKN